VNQRILILSQVQFGSVIAPYQYSRYLKDRFAITYLCWDYDYPRLDEPGVTVKYVSRQGGKIQRLTRFVRACVREIQHGRYDLVFVVYFQGCFLLPLFTGRNHKVLDIRTGYVRSRGLKRWLSNRLIYLESLFYRSITILSESLREDLGISARKCCLVPLGATHAEFPPKTFEEIRLLYVGTLQHRFIEKTVEGFARFYDEHHNGLRMSYVIVGAGRPDDEQRLRDATQRTSCRQQIRYAGWVDHKDLGRYFAEANIGVAFIPLEDHFQVQPATKVFEYLLAGMPVIATNTLENARTINRSNGVLTSDTSEDFHRGLNEILNARHLYDSKAISGSSTKYTWSYIITHQLYPFLVSLMKEPSCVS
jgi:glycosyltransferase involved in cell wall biosynthesis